MGNSAPHRAILYCKLGVHEVMKTGECSGDTVDPEDLQKSGLDETFVLWVDGVDKYDCIKNTVNQVRKFMGKEDG